MLRSDQFPIPQPSPRSQQGIFLKICSKMSRLFFWSTKERFFGFKHWLFPAGYRFSLTVLWVFSCGTIIAREKERERGGERGREKSIPSCFVCRGREGGMSQADKEKKENLAAGEIDRVRLVIRFFFFFSLGATSALQCAWLVCSPSPDMQQQPIWSIQAMFSTQGILLELFYFPSIPLSPAARKHTEMANDMSHYQAF